jgi:hypothetical protein
VNAAELSCHITTSALAIGSFVTAFNTRPRTVVRCSSCALFPRPNVDPTHTTPAITSAIPQIHTRTVASLHAYLTWYVPYLHTVADSTTFLVHLVFILNHLEKEALKL